MDQIQRWTFDYVTKFSKVSPQYARKLINDLIKECEFTEEESVELVNIMPKTLEELRTFTFGWKKLILTSTLEKALAKIMASHES
jgi:DNA-directed RNA polymerase subunit F